MGEAAQPGSRNVTTEGYHLLGVHLSSWRLDLHNLPFGDIEHYKSLWFNKYIVSSKVHIPLTSKSFLQYFRIAFQFSILCGCMILPCSWLTFGLLVKSVSSRSSSWKLQHSIPCLYGLGITSYQTVNMAEAMLAICKIGIFLSKDEFLALPGWKGLNVLNSTQCPVGLLKNSAIPEASCFSICFEFLYYWLNETPRK